jgi:hypothetical protein
LKKKETPMNNLEVVKVYQDLSELKDIEKAPVELSIAEYEQLIKQKEIELLDLKLEYKEKLNTLMYNDKDDLKENNEQI